MSAAAAELPLALSAMNALTVVMPCTRQALNIKILPPLKAFSVHGWHSWLSVCWTQEIP